ncbi:MAG TPA: hypothetical protein VG936_02350 [Lacunisphaera sp.]|nr:hypothetical protein [Lacunisphaera sp.]
MAHKKYTVSLTAAQAARIEKMAGALRVTPERLIQVLAISDMDCWDCANTFLEIWPQVRDIYSAKASDGRPKIEDELAHVLGFDKKKRAA